MSRLHKSLLSCFLLTAVLFCPSIAKGEESKDLLQKAHWAAAQKKIEKRSGQILVWSKPGALKKSLRSFSWQPIADNLALVRTGVDDLKRLRKTKGILAAEKNDPVKAYGLGNDPLGYRTWSFENRYRKYYAVGPYAAKKRNLKKRSTRDADIDLLKAWRIEKGSASTKVAVIDTGVDPYHADLQGNLWNNPGEIANNGIDDDGNGLIDDVNGWNFFDNNNQIEDVFGHGTHVAGTIGARSGNGQAVPGINQEVAIINAKVLSDSGMGDDASIAAGVLYAIEQGARVINGSLGGPQPMPVLAKIIKDNPQVLFVFAAGNESSSMKQKKSKSWPCVIGAANNICVAASNARDRLANFSNYNKRSVHLAAPGQDILSLVPYSHGCPGAPGKSCINATRFNSMSTPFTEWTHGGTGDDWGEERVLGDFFKEPLLGLSDSASGNYAPNSDSWALSPEKNITSPSPACRYEGVATGKLENGEDVLRISLSTDGGATFSKVGAYTGSLEIDVGFFVFPLSSISIPLPQAAGQTSFRLKYSLTSDADTEYSGATILESLLLCQGTLANATVFSGTSMAAPHVAGVAALLFSHKPGAGPLRVKKAILEGVDKKKSLRGKTSTAGRLNAHKALQKLK